MQSLHRLNNAIYRHEHSYYDPAGNDLVDMFEDLQTKDEEAKKNVIGRMGESGDIRRVSYELYNPSSNIFDDDSVLSITKAPESDSEFSAPDYEAHTDDIQCTSVYRLRHGDKLFADIKNYHNLKIIDYSETSLTYPLLVLDSMNSAGESPGGRLDTPFFSDNLDVVGQIYNFYYPLEVGYRSVEFEDHIETSGEIYDLNFPLIVGYQATWLDDEMGTSPWVFDMTFPLEVAYIKYSITPEEIETHGTIYAMFFNV